jgi:hypothetical protein
VLDRIHKIAYMCESQRASINVASEWCKKLGYKLHCFGIALDKNEQPIYHTNVMMSIGTEIAVVCLEVIKSEEKRNNLLKELSNYFEVIKITVDQMHHFCGNVLELETPSKQKILVMSKVAYQHFTTEQLSILEKHHIKPFYCDISTIETYGGGSVRCCIAELF